MSPHRSPLHMSQARHGATFGDVDGWEMPHRFTSALDEHAAFRSGAAIVDRSHQGRLRLTGPKRLDLLHRLATQDLRALAPGQGARAAMLTDKGRILDDLRVYAFADHVILLTSPGRADLIRRHIESLRFRDAVPIEEITHDTALVMVAGPRAAELLARAAGVTTLQDLPRHHHVTLTLAGEPVIAARAAGLDDVAVRLLMAASGAPAVWDALREADAGIGALPVGEDAHERRRIERGVPRAGRELTEDHNPLEARLDDAISWTKGCYVGQEVVARLDSRHKVSRLLCGLWFEPGGDESFVPASGETLEAPDRPGVAAGVITSAAASPLFGGPIALAYVRQEFSAPGTPLHVVSAEGRVAATVSDLPFRRP
jgi:folate-binding protein YgfZ